MSGSSIKFRCQECGQLLGVARSKAGSPVGCPKCGETLFVPLASTDVTAAPPNPSKPDRPPGATASGTASWPTDVPFPTNFPEAPRRSADEPRPAPPPVTFDLTEFNSEAERRGYEPPRPTPADPAEDARPAPELALPPIRVDETRASAGSRRATPPARPGDLVLPRTVVTAWSLFVLLALACAFVAGLMVGHYFWTAR